ncbi:hypothetical protein HDU67_007454 [Dinochytrium kinnereticum]|nr:hypothetical protein HDU67_007454 [Dinochytrium kinnereticum]
MQEASFQGKKRQGPKGHLNIVFESGIPGSNKPPTDSTPEAATEEADRKVVEEAEVKDESGGEADENPAGPCLREEVEGLGGKPNAAFDPAGVDENGHRLRGVEAVDLHERRADGPRKALDAAVKVDLCMFRFYFFQLTNFKLLGDERALASSSLRVVATRAASCITLRWYGPASVISLWDGCGERLFAAGYWENVGDSTKTLRFTSSCSANTLGKYGEKNLERLRRPGRKKIQFMSR